jgi:hypothetical protein
MSRTTPKLLVTLVALGALTLSSDAAFAGGGPPKGPGKCAVGAVGGEGRTAPPWVLLAITAGLVALRRGGRTPRPAAPK